MSSPPPASAAAAAGSSPPSATAASSSPADLRSSSELVDGSGTGAGVGTGSDGLTSKEREQLHLQSSAFDALERDFREVLNELVGDKSLERFRLEYEKLHHTLKKSHENEVRLALHSPLRGDTSLLLPPFA
jgi:hypothetical protein